MAFHIVVLLNRLIENTVYGCANLCVPIPMTIIVAVFVSLLAIFSIHVEYNLG